MSRDVHSCTHWLKPPATPPLSPPIGTRIRGQISKVYLGSMSRDVHSCTYWLRPRKPPPPPALGLEYEGAIGQERKVDDTSL
jgi:hypothetical protein